MRYFLCLLLLLPYEAFAQRPIIDDFFLFETADPVKMYAVQQDKAGYMWLGTSTGLYRFNGLGDIANIPSKFQQPVTAVALFGNHVYVGYLNGDIGQVFGDSVILLRIKSDKPHHFIRDLLVNNAGIWAATEDGLYAVINGNGYLVDKQKGLPDNVVHSMAPSTDNGLLLGTNAGFCKLNIREGKLALTQFTTSNSSPGNSVRVLKTIPRANWVWLGTAANGITKAVMNGDKVSLLSYQGSWKWGAVKDILVLSQNHVWVGSDGYLLDVHVQDSITIKAYEYPGRSFNRLAYTQSGVIWAGTDMGLSVLSAEIAAEKEILPPYKMSELTATTCDRLNNLWFAESNSLYRTPLDRKTTPEHICTLPGVVTCLYADNAGEVWIGTAGRGLLRFRQGQLISANISEKKLDTVFSISRLGPHLWVSSSNGVDEYAVEQNQLQLFRHHQLADIGTARVTYLYSDRKGRMWMAAHGAGVYMYDNRYHRYDSAVGIGSNVASTVTEDAYGNIWVGTLNRGGLSRFDGKIWHHFEHKNGLQNLNISSLTANATGQVIVVNDVGVDEWFPSSNQFRRFNVYTNPSIDSTSYVRNIAFRDTAGNVYMPGVKVLLQFRNVTEPVVLKPQVFISKVSVFLKPVPPDKHDFAYKENNISFTIEGINFSNYEHLHYRYRLEGYNSDWVDLLEKTVTFPQLNPGKYTFRIQASLDTDFEEAVEDNYSFTVFSPLWMRPWFIVLALICVGSLLFLFIRQRERNLNNLSRLKQERVQYEFELFRSQVNPHFLFNSLNILIDLIEANPANAVDYTVQLSALYRNILTSQNKDTFLLAEECRLLSAYAHIQRSRFGDALQLITDIPQTVLDTCKIVPLALQMLIENAIKHNSVSLSSPLVIRIYISAEKEIVVQNRIQPRMSPETGTGIGLQNITKRYSLLTPKAVWHGIVGNNYFVKLPLL